jgi:3-deoxy-D-manno-octulosonate 8-phosphate phosphatase (KDO 8-P phosphatase)
MKPKPLELFCLDVDGVMTDGSFLYSQEGKVLKRFGPEDGDALQILRQFIDIRFVTADFRGLDISRARIERDLGFPLELVPSTDRRRWLNGKCDLSRVAYMGDSFSDIPILKSVAVAIAPANASAGAKRVANFTTKSAGGEGAVAEACFYVAKIIGATPPEFEA